MNEISSKQLKLLEIIGHEPGVSQREIAKKSGFSLGMVNLILRRLARTGYIKVANLDRQKMSYLLTAKAIAEKSRRSYEYLVRTIRTYDQYRERITRLVNDQIQQGIKGFIVYGNGDLADLIHVLLQSSGNSLKIQRCHPPEIPKPNASEIVLNCSLVDDQPVEGISILENLLKDKVLTLREEHHELV